MKVVVVGGGGYLGRPLARLLREHAETVSASRHRGKDVDEQLDLRRPCRFEPNAGEEVRARTEQVAKHRQECGRPGHKGQKAGMVDAKRVWRHLGRELFEDRREVTATLRRRLTQQRFQLGARSCSADSLFRQRLEMPQQPIQCQVCLFAQGGNVRMRERLGYLAAATG